MLVLFFATSFSFLAGPFPLFHSSRRGPSPFRINRPGGCPAVYWFYSKRLEPPQVYYRNSPAAPFTPFISSVTQQTCTRQRWLSVSSHSELEAQNPQLPLYLQRNSPVWWRETCSEQPNVGTRLLSQCHCAVLLRKCVYSRSHSHQHRWYKPVTGLVCAPANPERTQQPESYLETWLEWKKGLNVGTEVKLDFWFYEILSKRFSADV